MWFGIVFCGVLAEQSDIVQVCPQVESLGLCNAAQTMVRCGPLDKTRNYLLLSWLCYRRLIGIGLDWRNTTNPL